MRGAGAVNTRTPFHLLLLALALRPLQLLVIPTVVQPFNHILLLPAVLLCVLFGRIFASAIACSVLCAHHLFGWFTALAVAAAVTIGLLFGPLRWLLRMWFFPTQRQPWPTTFRRLLYLGPAAQGGPVCNRLPECAQIRFCYTLDGTIPNLLRDATAHEGLALVRAELVRCRNRLDLHDQGSRAWEHGSGVRDGIKTQMGDLYSPWMGTRELILHHRNPYGPEVTHEIQMAFLWP